MSWRLVRRAGLVAIAAVIALGLLADVIDGFSPGAGGPRSSSYSTAPDGLAAYSTLLARSGHVVTELRASLADSRLSPGETLVVLDPDRVTQADAAAVRRFVLAGGVLVSGGRDPGWLAGVVSDPPAWSPDGPVVSEPLAPSSSTAGIGRVLSARDGWWTDARATLPVLGASGGSLLSIATAGRGRVALLADATPLQNERLAIADNAALGIDLAGPSGRPVAFAESVHGLSMARGLGALPARWRWALVGLALATAVAIAARIRRLGAPDSSTEAALPPRRAHVEALARALARTRCPGEAAQPVQAHARALLLRRSALPADAPADAVTRAAARLGLDPAEARALSSTSLDDIDLFAAGRALAKLSRARP
ncbi:MAG: DUF4350 domain-containing protein [Actinomycetota bacterium]|nr:DUF4350 domain-containing protein [Actinomycetota bacterium]